MHNQRENEKEKSDTVCQGEQMQGVVDTHQVVQQQLSYFLQAGPSFYFLVHVTRCMFASTVRFLIRNIDSRQGLTMLVSTITHDNVI